MMKNISQFLVEVKGELSKVVWPGYDELIDSIIVVLILVIAFSIYLGSIDFIFYRIAQQLF